MTRTHSSPCRHHADAVADSRARLAEVNRQLAALFDWPLLDWQALRTAGSRNGIFRAEHAGQSWVLRLNDRQGLAFGVERQREAKVLAAIQGYDWAPRLRHNAWQQGWCLMADHGEVVESAADSGADANAALLAAVSQWQRLDPGRLAIEPHDYRALLEHYRQAFSERADAAALKVLHSLSQRLAALPDVAACLSHHDLHPGNLCQQPDRSSSKGRAPLVVLDWEYAGIANPWFDAAALRLQFGVSAAQIAALPAWHALDAAPFERGLARACQLSQTLDWLWHRLRGDAKGAGPPPAG